MKVYITRKLHPSAYELLNNHFETVEQNSDNSPLDKNRLREVCNSYDAILSTCVDKIDATILEETKTLKLISNYAVGLDNIDLDAAKINDIKVFNTPDVVTNSTADHTLALILGITRRVLEGTNFVKNGKWSSWDPHLLLGGELSNMTVGIIGYGRIGQAVAKRLSGFTNNILCYDKHCAEAPDDTATFCDLKTLLSESDVITIHAPGGADNTHLLGANAFKVIEDAQRYPYIINTARGEIICSDTLNNALEKRIIRGAALDVVENEPIGANHQLLKHSNCIITPHIGTATLDTRIMMAELAAKNIIENL